MGKKQKIIKPKPILPRGFRDIPQFEIQAMADMISKIAKIYDLYGFEALDTPAIEYTDALGKFLPDEDRPNLGVFSFLDDDEKWLSLRYDLTAPLARYVAQNYDGLAKPFRRYQFGYVFRNEKPGPGRYRQFMQFDADSVGTASSSADAELCMMAADCLKELGFKIGEYKIKVNNRKLLSAILEKIFHNKPDMEVDSLTILRAIDKLDRLGIDGVRELLGKGRKDISGDFTKGANLGDDEIETVISFVTAGSNDRELCLNNLKKIVEGNEIGEQGVAELDEMVAQFDNLGYGADEIIIDPSIVRGLEYYTGPVFEAELTFEIKDEKGNKVSFGSIGGGGRYDGLVERFKAVKVPATGFSFGVSRLYAALDMLKENKAKISTAPVIVTVMDKDKLLDYHKLTAKLRKAGIRAETYVGESGMRAQLKYADKREALAVIIIGEDERKAGLVSIKDLKLGKELSSEISDNEQWRKDNKAQFNVKEDELIAALNKIIAR